MLKMKISASEVKKLREMTGAGMMDCKKALTEAEGDLDKAIEILRKKGQKLSMKRADREAKEGVVVAMVNDASTKGIVIRLSCETDFVAKNEDFINLAKSFATIALENFPADKEALLAASYADGLSILDKVTEQVGVIGEKVEIADYSNIEADLVVPYIHAGYRAGVIVGFNQNGDKVEEAGKNIAMQIAAMKPIAVSKDEVSQEVIDKELEIAFETAKNEERNAGKPEQVLRGIAQGKLNKFFFKDRILLNQDYVKGNKQSVQDYLKTVDSGLAVTGFKHIMLG